MNPLLVIQQLAANTGVFQALFENVPEEMIRWKASESNWCLLEIACHLGDEEREDFRARLESVLADPTQPLPASDPQGWVKSRDYMNQNFCDVVRTLLRERELSVEWLRSLEQPSWDNAFQHKRLGPLSATLFLENWLAHDYLHIRQINRRKYEYLHRHANCDLDYAGEW